MKKIIAALLALTLMLCLTACGGAKTETIYVQTQSVRTIGEAVIRTEYTYGKTGRLVTMKMYFNDELYQTMSNRTSNGVVYMTITDAEGNSYIQSSVTTYDSEGRLSKMEIYSSGSTVTRTSYTYDDQDRILTEETLTTEGTTKTAYTYDEAGNVIAMESANADTGEFVRIEYTYDDRGYVTLEKELDQEGAVLSSIAYTYEGESVRIQTHYDDQGEPTGQVDRLEYDEHGNLVKETTMQDGEVAQTIVSTYEAMEVPVED